MEVGKVGVCLQLAGRCEFGLNSKIIRSYAAYSIERAFRRLFVDIS